MEAENYLSSGYGHGLALRAVLGSEAILGVVANVWQPSRLKGITVEREFGTPFLAATQAFDLRPVPRKFLSLDRTDSAADRFTKEGTVLITCSGSVGRATLATGALSGVLISHDLLRIEPREEKLRGWIYAYLRAAKTRAMMSSAQYGHIIKHLEPSHLTALPMPRPTDAVAAEFQKDVHRVLAARNRASDLMTKAEALFESHVGTPKSLDSGEDGFSIRASALMSGRRRLEGVFNNPVARKLQAHFKSKKLRTTSLAEAGFDVWLPTRFRRIPAEEGALLVGSSDLFEINPDLVKRIAEVDFGDARGGQVKRGWLLLARSGQTYGLNGTLAIANAFHEGKIISDHVIRIAPRKDCDARAGYVYAALSHPVLGRPLVKALAYGSSIPEIDVADIESLPMVRLGDSVEAEIADLAEEGASLFATADILENEIAARADELIEGLLGGQWTNFVRFP
jgi:hypothetical protein